MSSVISAGQIVRTVISLGVVIGIMVVAARVLRRRGVARPGGRRGFSLAMKSSGPRASGIEVVDRIGITRASSVALLKVGSRYLVIGASDSSIELLAEGDGAVAGLWSVADEIELEEDELEVMETYRTSSPLGAPQNRAWTMLLDAMREKTVRRV
jgi:flagellar biogenesis protein FliO